MPSSDDYQINAANSLDLNVMDCCVWANLRRGGVLYTFPGGVGRRAIRAAHRGRVC